MALDRSSTYPGFFDNPTPTRPQGAFKNETSEGAEDGSYLDKDWMNDICGLIDAILVEADESPNGSIDEGGNSQVYNALEGLFITSVSSQVITASQTYTPASNVNAIKVTLIGGGGGAGGTNGQGSGTCALGGSGGGGGSSVILIANLESSYSIVIGAGGAGGAAGANDGLTGGTSTFIGDDTASTSLSCSGGLGGSGGTGSSGTFSAQGGTGGAASGGDLNITGGDASHAFGVEGDRASHPASGGSILGMPQRPSVSSDNPGINAPLYGAGGSGAVSFNVTTNNAGGDGSQGVCIIEEYF